MSNIAIRLRDVAVRFKPSRHVSARRFQALHDVSMDLFHGEKLGIIGSNGAGKSTLLRVLADVLQPDCGTVDRHHGRCQLLALGLGFINSLTGRENAVLSGLLLGLGRKQVVANLEQVKDFSELGDFFDEPLNTYSSGMRSRLGFAVAIQNNPDVLLIDEALAVGDAAFQKKSLAALRERLSGNATVAIVSHSVATINSLCDRALWVDKGRVIAAGDTAKILDDYKKGNA